MAPCAEIQIPGGLKNGPLGRVPPGAGGLVGLPGGFVEPPDEEGGFALLLNGGVIFCGGGLACPAASDDLIGSNTAVTPITPKRSWRRIWENIVLHPSRYR